MQYKKILFSKMWWKATLLLFSTTTLTLTSSRIIDGVTIHEVTIPSVTTKYLTTVNEDLLNREGDKNNDSTNDSDYDNKEIPINSVDDSNNILSYEEMQPVKDIDDDYKEPSIIGEDDTDNNTLPDNEKQTIKDMDDDNNKEPVLSREEDNNDTLPDEEKQPVKDIDDDNKESPITTENDNDDDNEELDFDCPKTDILVVETKYGPIQGVYESNTPSVNFLDIPYGAVKSRVFLPPSEPDGWEDVRIKTEHTIHCKQMQNDDVDPNSQTECLTLSVFTPAIPSHSRHVIFHIHHGDFHHGSGDPSYYGPKHLVNSNLVVVLPNYRLGMLGFLCLQNNIAPGNAGLKDLTLALKWTKENIAKFGGDPNNIAVSGFGSAAALAGYLAVSPMSKHYFTKVIVDSGSMFAHWALDRDPLYTARDVAEKLKDRTSEFTEEEINQLLKETNDIQFKPCIETGDNSDVFINKSPWAILQDNTTEIKTIFLMGSADLAGMHEALSHSIGSLAEINKDFSKVLPNDLFFRKEEEMLRIGEIVKEYYFGEEEVNSTKLTELARYYTDVSYLAPMLREARALIRRGATVYLYEFGYVGKYNRERETLKTHLDGAARGDAIGYVFTRNGDLPHHEENDKAVLGLMVTLWKDFVATDEPCVQGVSLQELQPVNETDESWLHIGTELTLKKGFHVDRIRLWTQIYDEYFDDENNFAQKIRILNLTVFLTITSIVIFKSLQF